MFILYKMRTISFLGIGIQIFLPHNILVSFQLGELWFHLMPLKLRFLQWNEL